MKTNTMIMPKELTAENGAKALMIGEFKETINTICPECGDEGGAEDCFECDGSGVIDIDVIVSWTTIKEIYAMAVKHLAIRGE